MKNLLTQAEMLNLFTPIFQQKKVKYRKNKDVLVRPAIEGEIIVTHTGDGEETRNIAKKDSFIIKNTTQAGEEYIISKAKLAEKYVLKSENTEGGYSLYQSIGFVEAIELDKSILKTFNLPNEFYFATTWGDKMVAKQGDYLVLTPEKSIYRIALKEFFETYIKVE